MDILSVFFLPLAQCSIFHCCPTFTEICGYDFSYNNLLIYYYRRGDVSSPSTGENSPSFIRGGLMLQCLLSQVSSDTAWPWHSAHYLYGSINGFHDASSSSLKIPQMKSFFLCSSTVSATFSENPVSFGFLFSG